MAVVGLPDGIAKTRNQPLLPMPPPAQLHPRIRPSRLLRQQVPDRIGDRAHTEQEHDQPDDLHVLLASSPLAVFLDEVHQRPDLSIHRGGGIGQLLLAGSHFGRRFRRRLGIARLGCHHAGRRIIRDRGRRMLAGVPERAKWEWRNHLDNVHLNSRPVLHPLV